MTNHKPTLAAGAVLLAWLSPAFAQGGPLSLPGPPTGPSWQYGYDAMGRPTSAVDPNGLATYTYYDSLGRPIQTQQPANTGNPKPTVTSYQYNADDKLTLVSDPRNLATSYNPNGLGDVTLQKSPDTGPSRYTYDAAGNILTRTDARNNVSSYDYDSLNRPVRIRYAGGVDSLLEYDGGATPVPAATGELTGLSDASGITKYSYDPAGRRIRKAQTITTAAGASKSFTVLYSWGDAGSALDKLTAITYPSGARVNYSYDATGSVSAISVTPAGRSGPGGRPPLPLLDGVTYSPENRLSGWLWANGNKQAITYDGLGQIASYKLGDPQGQGIAAGVQRSVLRDSAGRITGFSHTSGEQPVAPLEQAFAYDNLNRLVSARLGVSNIGYSYDATGNRVGMAVSGASYTNTIDAASNKLVRTQDAGGTYNIRHDAAGNIIGDGVNNYSYSDRGRLSTASPGGSLPNTVSYVYNALEQRAAKSGPQAVVPTGAAYYVYDEEGKLLGEYDATGTPIYETVYLGIPVGVIKQTGSSADGTLATSLYNVYADQLGAPRVITRQSDEAIVWRWDSAEAFGATAPNQNPSGLGAFVYNQRLPGQVFDAETGLFQNWNREYNPRLGRYMQSDPIGLAGGINTFAYVGGDPLRYSDPLGLASTEHYLDEWICSSNSWDEAFSKALKGKMISASDADNRTAAEHYIFGRALRTENSVLSSLNAATGLLWPTFYKAAKDTGTWEALRGKKASPASDAQRAWGEKAWWDAFNYHQFYTNSLGKCGCEK